MGVHNTVRGVISKPLVKSEVISIHTKVEKAFIRAFDECAPKLYRFCLVRVGSKELSEDFVSQTFLQTWQYMQNGETIKSYPAFLYRVLRNVMADHWRGRGAKTVLINESMADTLVDDQYLPESMENAVEIKRIIKAFQILPKEQTEILHWRFVDGLSISDIAELSGKKPNAIYVSIYRSLKKLKQQFNDHV